MRPGLGETLPAPAVKWIYSEASCSGSCSWLPASDPAQYLSEQLPKNEVTRSARPGTARQERPVAVPGRTPSGRRAAPLSPDRWQFHWVHLSPELRKDANLALPAPQLRRFQGCLFVERIIYFPDTVEVEGCVFEHRELRVGAAIMLSQLQRIATVQEKSNSFSCVSKHLY